MKKDLSQEEQDRIEADFLRAEAKREAVDRMNRRRKKKQIKDHLWHIPFLLLWPAWSFAAVLVLVHGFLRFAYGIEFGVGFIAPALMFAVIWSAAATISILRLKAIIDNQKQNKSEHSTE